MNQEYTVDLSGVFGLVECSMCQIVTNTSSPFEDLTHIYHLFVSFPHLLTLTENPAEAMKLFAERHCLLFPDTKSSSLIKKEKIVSSP